MQNDLVLYKVKENSTKLIPLAGAMIHAGFESPATDYEEEALDLNDYVTSYPEATFYAKVDGDCMTGSGIYPNDLLVVNKSLPVRNGDVVVGVIEGEFILRAYLEKNGKRYLVPDNPNYKAIEITDDNPFVIWGVVPHSVINQQNLRNVRFNRLQQFLCEL